MLHYFPKWRGAAPIERSILNKDKETGIRLRGVSELDMDPILNGKTKIKKGLSVW